MSEKTSFDRPTAHQRGYTLAWSRFARDQLAINPVCAVCGAPAEVLGHLLMSGAAMMEKFGEFPLVPNYYRSLCRSCNRLDKTRNGR